jgi:hypothetical protein
MPDFAYIRKELLKNGGSRKLLWTEYIEDCRQAGDEPLMYSQFCYYIQQDENKRRAIMHINRKPAEQVEVDWAGRYRRTDRSLYRGNRTCIYPCRRDDIQPVCVCGSVPR